MLDIGIGLDTDIKLEKACSPLTTYIKGKENYGDNQEGTWTTPESKGTI